MEPLKEACGNLLFDIMASTAPAILWEVVEEYKLERTKKRLIAHIALYFKVCMAF